MQKLVEQGKKYRFREALMALVELLGYYVVCRRNIDKCPLLNQLLHIHQAILSDTEQVANELNTVLSMETSILSLHPSMCVACPHALVSIWR